MKRFAWYQLDPRVQMLSDRLLDFIPLAPTFRRAFERNSDPQFLLDVRTRQVQRKLDHWRYLLTDRRLEVSDSSAIEVGTGWSGIDLLFLHLLGFRKIYTLDVRRNLMPEQFYASLDGLLAVGDEAENDLGLRDAKQRLGTIPRSGLSDALRHLGVLCVTGRELATLRLPTGSAGFFYSYSSLHCLSRPELERTIRELQRVLRPGSYAYTDVRFVDNYYKGQSNAKPLGYLEYPDWLMKLAQSRNFNSQSRIRHIEYLTLMADAGFTLETEQVTWLDREAIANVRLAERFKNFPLEDLRVANATMVHKLSGS